MTSILTVCHPLCAERCSWIPWWVPPRFPTKWDLLLTHLTDETTEAQRGDVICAGSRSL